MHPDYFREVHCLLGLPFDSVNMAEAEHRIRVAAADHSRCFLSTPNLNFLIAAQNDVAFRNSVINSDLSVADGMPLVWIARLLGIPLRERVAGSALFDALRQPSEKSLSVFFFGGPEGAAEAASQKLSLEGQGLTCVGFETPGFGSVEEMSKEGFIQRINASKADFLVVSLGAKKGQAWIERNRKQITVPIISHLGAVVNFVAGTVQRAPVWMQRIGLEWLWRIKEDPVLWRRYASDGWAFMSLGITRVIPYAWFVYWNKPAVQELCSTAIKLFENGDEVVIQLSGAWVQDNLMPLRECFSKISQEKINIRINFEQVSYVDSACIGLLMLLYGEQLQCGKQFIVENASTGVRKIFRYACAEFLFEN